MTPSNFPCSGTYNPTAQMSDASPPAKPVAKLQTLRQDKVRAMAGQEGVSVFEYVHDEPEGVMSGKEQARALRDVCATFDAGCKAEPLASDEALRQRILQSAAHLRKFQRLYPRAFASVTVRVQGDPVATRKLEEHRKMTMLFMVERWKGKGSEEEKAARAMNIAARVSMRPTRPEDVQEGSIATRLDEVEGAHSLPPMEPLSIDSFGGVVVNQ